MKPLRVYGLFHAGWLPTPADAALLSQLADEQVLAGIIDRGLGLHRALDLFEQARLTGDQRALRDAHEQARALFGQHVVLAVEQLLQGRRA